MSKRIALSEMALFTIGEAQRSRALFVSPITAWELSVATLKGQAANRPFLGGDPPEKWFRDAMRSTGARVIAIHQRIACEAARVVLDTGHRDPGDCFLIATARVRRLTLLTRDSTIHAIAAKLPGYLDAIAC